MPYFPNAKTKARLRKRDEVGAATLRPGCREGTRYYAQIELTVLSEPELGTEPGLG